MQNYPVEQFKDINQAIELLNEWKERLGLFDWIIKIKLCEPHQFKLQDTMGECEFTPVIKNAVIRILKPEYYGDRIQKFCAEHSLIHELLHCKFALFEIENNEFLHQIQEDIAVSLICAKYGITRDWFNNISYEEVKLEITD